MEETSNYTISEPANDTDTLLAELRGDAATDRGNAERLIALHGRDMRYVTEWQSWVLWRGSHWSRASEGEILQLAQDTVDQMFLDAANGDRRDRQERVAWAQKSEGSPRLSAMVKLARGQAGVEISARDLDSDFTLLNVQNGTIDLETGELNDHSRDDLITRIVPVYFDPRAAAPRWELFLTEIMPDDPIMVAFLQRVAGYLLTGHTKEQALFVAYGNGRNGKGKFLNTLTALMGPYAAQLPTRVLLSGSSSQKDYALATLPGVRFTLASETQVGARFDEPLVKAMTGGDTITARSPYEKPFQYVPQFKIVLMTNERPQVKGMDDGIWRRMVPIHFAVDFSEEEDDKQLGEKLLAELPGILNWVLEGLRQWRRVGLMIPHDISEERARWRDAENPALDFLQENVVNQPGERIAVKRMFEMYLSHAKAQGERRPLGKQHFNRALEKLGYTRQSNVPGGASAWQDVRFREHIISIGSNIVSAIA